MKKINILNLFFQYINPPKKNKYSEFIFFWGFSFIRVEAIGVGISDSDSDKLCYTAGFVAGSKLS